MKINKQKWICHILFAISILAILIYPDTDGVIKFLLYLFGVIGIYSVGRYKGKYNL